ncbi:MAG: LysM peptidoglycan-binding domain-containing protein [Paraprevotella sp.]|nr:LysM peptidoglycan-binding domain-containing protein [Paraprevotella sp.]
MAHRKNSIYAVIILLFLQLMARAQDAGTFTHTIKQGETVYSIARTYQVTPESILKLNPSAVGGIKAGETLTIPQQQNGTETKRFHTIQAGETLYQLTKTYQVSADDICLANPGLTADNFKAGMVIRIPAPSDTARPAAVQPQPQPQGIAQSGCKEMHKVKRKETLYSIARDYNLTEEELKAANPDMAQPDYKLRKGDFVCIPFPKPQKPQEIIPSNTELLDRNVTTAPKKLIRMGVILPFKGGTSENNKMVEFYRGVLLAVGEMKQAGISVDIFAYDSGKSAGDMKNVVNTHPITDLDLIIGPLYPEQIDPLSKFCQQHHIRLVVPFSSLGEDVYQNPYYYAINPPKSFLHSEASRLTTELFGKANMILLDSNTQDKDASAFTEAVNKRLQQNGGSFTTLQLDDDEMKWLSAMNQYKDNVIIPNSSDIKILNQLFPKLKEFAKNNPENRIKLVGYPEWQTYTSSQLDNFYQFDTYVYSSFFRNPLSESSSQFEKTYQQSFHEPTILSWPRFGMLGFDTATYFLKGLSTYGDAIDTHLTQIVTTPYQHRFDFHRISNWSGFINSDMEFIHYTPAHSIELIRLKK